MVHLANAVADREDVALLLPRRLVRQYSQFLKANINIYPFTSPMYCSVKEVSMIRNIVRSINRIRPNVLHIQEGHIWFNLTLPMIKRRYCLVTTVHDVNPHPGAWLPNRIPLRNLAIRHSSSLIVHGKKLKENLVSRFKVSESTVSIVPHGELAIYRSFGNRNVKEEDSLVLFLGRIRKYKGLPYLIAAEPIISRSVPDLRIIIGGEGKDLIKYEKEIRNRKKFTFINEYVTNDTLADLFRGPSVVVLPYTEASQSGIIPIAYAFRKPVVATDVGSIPEIADHGETGYIVPPRDPEKLAEAVIDVLTDKQKRKKMGELAYNKARADLSWENIAERTVNVYRKTLSPSQ